MTDKSIIDDKILDLESNSDMELKSSIELALRLRRKVGLFAILGTFFNIYYVVFHGPYTFTDHPTLTFFLLGLTFILLTIAGGIALGLIFSLLPIKGLPFLVKLPLLGVFGACMINAGLLYLYL